MRLKDKVAVVTGGGSGIGRETCLLFAEEGAHVVVVDRYLEDAQDTVQRIEENKGPEAIAVQADVAKESDVNALANVSMEKFGQVDVLVNNAGVRVFGPVTEADEETWDFIFDVNLKGVGYCCKHIIPLMASNGGGSIVNISSANAVVGRPNMGLYDATKAGVLALTRSMACDHAEQNIRVNAILPGPVFTDYHVKRAKEAGRVLDTSVTERNPNGPGILKRQAKPKELAYGILFLACDESSYVTGACLNIDGGLSALAQRN